MRLACRRRTAAIVNEAFVREHLGGRDPIGLPIRFRDGDDAFTELQVVKLWGRGRVYSAMVAGVELEPEFDMKREDAANRAIEGAADLCSRGIIPVYSLHWPTGGKERADYQSRLRNYFERLALAYREIRQQNDLQVWDGFMCHRCAYMQLECDVDRAGG